MQARPKRIHRVRAADLHECELASHSLRGEMETVDPLATIANLESVMGDRPLARKRPGLRAYLQTPASEGTPEDPARTRRVAASSRRLHVFCRVLIRKSLNRKSRMHRAPVANIRIGNQNRRNLDANSRADPQRRPLGSTHEFCRHSEAHSGPSFVYVAANWAAAIAACPNAIPPSLGGTFLFRRTGGRLFDSSSPVRRDRRIALQKTPPESATVLRFSFRDASMTSAPRLGRIARGTGTQDLQPNRSATRATSSQTSGVASILRSSSPVRSNKLRRSSAELRPELRNAHSRDIAAWASKWFSLHNPSSAAKPSKTALAPLLWAQEKSLRIIRHSNAQMPGLGSTDASQADLRIPLQTPDTATRRHIGLCRAPRHLHLRGAAADPPSLW